VCVTLVLSGTVAVTSTACAAVAVFDTGQGVSHFLPQPPDPACDGLTSAWRSARRRPAVVKCRMCNDGLGGRAAKRRVPCH